MKYKVTEYHSDFQEEQTGTCELCFGTAWVEEGSITVEDENGTETEIYLTVWDWGDYDTIYIDNVVNFSAWLQEREVDPISEETEPWSWLHVKIRATKHYMAKDGTGKIFFSLAYKESFTKKELEEAGFGWVFSCEGIEIEEVK